MRSYREKYLDMGFVGVFLLLLPFIQMGLTFYLSVQMLLFFILLSYLCFSDLVKNIGWAVFLLVLMLTPALFYSVHDRLHMILGVGRQFLCLFILLLVLSHSRPVYVRVSNPENKIVVLLSFLFFITAIQYIGLKTGYAIYFPPSFFVSNQNTVIGYEKAVELGLYSGIRPSATYGEPSYLSFICVSIAFIAYSSFKSTKNLLLVTLLAFSTVLLANSLSGILALVVLFSARFMSHFKNFGSVVLAMACLMFLAVFVVVFRELPVIHRMLMFLGFGEGVDISLNIRIFSPFLLLSEVFSRYPFGLPKEMLSDVIAKNYAEGFKGTDNGFLNIFINFGCIGFIIVGVLFYKLKKNVFLTIFVLLSSMFNGAFFTFDKLAVIGVSVLLARSLAGDRYTLRISTKSRLKLDNNV